MQRFASLHCQNCMKQKSAFLILIVALLIAGCQKKSIQSKSLSGTWELRELQAGMTPTITYTGGDGNRLIFSASTYKKFKDNVEVSSGKYSVIKDNSVKETVGLVVPEGQFRQRINFENGPSAFFQVSGNKLTLLSGFFPTDGGSRAVYEKASD